MLAERDVWCYNPVLNRQTRTYAAFEFGLCVCRQNGKGSSLEARELAGLFLLGERTIIHAAHEFPTAAEAFERVAGLIDNTPILSRELRGRSGIKEGSGTQGIYLKNGQRLLFKTRTGGGVRGFSADCVVLDEAMKGLQAPEVDALLPTLSARPNPQIIYAGSAGTKESTQFGRVRARGIKGNDPRLAYMEWSINGHSENCPKSCREHDRQEIDDSEAARWSPEQYERALEEMVESYKIANPGLGIRITVEHVEAERRTMGKEGFARERLGVGDWPVEGEAYLVIDKDSWMNRIDKAAGPQETLVFSVDTTPDCSSSCIVAAGFSGEIAFGGDDGLTDMKQIHVEVTSDTVRYDHRPSRSWVMPRLKALILEHNPAAIVIDSVGQAGVFVTDLEAWLATDEVKDKGIKTVVLVPSIREAAQACGMFKDAVVARKDNVPYLTHMDQPMLTTAVAGAVKRDLAGMWAWNKRTPLVDISPLIAATNAFWGVIKMSSAPPPVEAWFSWE